MHVNVFAGRHGAAGRDPDRGIRHPRGAGRAFRAGPGSVAVSARPALEAAWCRRRGPHRQSTSHSAAGQEERLPEPQDAAH